MRWTSLDEFGLGSWRILWPPLWFGWCTWPPTPRPSSWQKGLPTDPWYFTAALGTMSAPICRSVWQTREQMHKRVRFMGPTPARGLALRGIHLRFGFLQFLCFLSLCSGFHIVFVTWIFSSFMILLYGQGDMLLHHLAELEQSARHWGFCGLPVLLLQSNVVV